MVSSDSFLSSIESFSPELRGALRKLRTGVFISEEVLGEVQKGYEEWMHAHSLSLKSDDKISKRIFGLESPPLYYLPEGQNCYCGYIAPVENIETVESLSVIPRSDSVAISATNFLHPKDPWCNRKEDIRVRRSPSTGTFVDFRFESATYSVKEVTLRAIGNYLRASSRFTKDFPEMEISLRGVITTLLVALKNAKKVSPGKRMYVPERYQSDQNVLKIFKNLILVIDKDNQLLDVYELKGKNFRKNVFDEIESLIPQKKNRFFEAVELCASKTGFFFRVKIKGKPFSIDKHAILDLIESVPSSPWMMGKVSPRYTVSEVLTAIGSALKYADWVNMSSLSSSQDAPKKGAKPHFELKYIPWTFDVGRNNTIIRFVEGKGRASGYPKRDIKR
jgi:hypothetical protein